MILAVVLQVVGSVLFVAGVAVLFGIAVATCVAGLIVFVAGFAHEHAGSR